MSAQRFAPPASAVPARPPVPSPTSPHEPAAAAAQGAPAWREERRLRIASLLVFVLL